MDPNWAASEELIDYVLANTNVGDTVLELGSGYSTERFIANGRKVITIEHDPVWINKVDGATYIHAPIKLYGDDYNPPPSIRKRLHEHTGWYNPQVIQEALQNQLYHIILIDGPPRNYGRSGFLQHLDIFPNLQCRIIFDDLHRLDDLYVASRVAQKLCRDLLVTNYGTTPLRQKPNGDWLFDEKKPFGVILL